MQFVEHDELEPAGVVDDLGVQGVLPRKQQLGHHEVRKQDIRRIVSDPLPLFLALLTRVAPYHRLQLFRQPGLGNKLLDFLDLAVCQCVHWVDDDCARLARSTGFSGAHDGVDHRDEETKRFPGARSRRHHIALTGACFGDGLSLMPVESYGSSADPEYLGSCLVQIPRRHEVVNRWARQKSRVQRKKGIRPEAPFIILTIDLACDVICSDSAEGARKARVGVDEIVIEFKSFHGKSYCSSACSWRPRIASRFKSTIC